MNLVRPVKRSIVSRAILAGVASVLLVVAGATPAHARGELDVSVDGTFSSANNPPIFTTVTGMVPLESQSATFVVRNSGDEPGYLRVSVSNVSTSTPVLAEALSVQASVTGYAGAPVALSSASPCRVLTEGFVLRPGRSVTVYSVLAMGDLDGQAGQNGFAAFSFDIGLSDVAPGSIAPTSCTPNSSVVPGPPDGPSTPPDPNNPGTANPDGQPGPDPVATPTDRPSATPTAEPEVPVFQWPAFPTFDLDTNTVRLFQDWGALVPGLAFVLGAGWFLFIARRRRKKEDEEENDDDDSDFDESYAV